MADLEQEIEEYIQQQFEAFQLSDHVGPAAAPAAAASKAANIQKHIQILALNHGISQMTLTGNNDEGENNKDLSSLLLPYLMRYTDAAVTMEVSADNKDAIHQVFHLVAALACTVSITCRHWTAVEAILSRAQEYSEVLLERLRSPACTLMGSLAVQLGAVLRRFHKTQSKKMNTNPEEQDVDADIFACLDHMETALLPRLADKSQAVRQSAIQAVGHLLTALSLVSKKESQATDQKPSSKTMKDEDDTESENEEEDDESKQEEDEKENLSLDGLLWSMWHDPSVANRIEAVQAVPISQETVDHIVARIRDVKDKVRVAALEVLRLKVDPRKDMTEEHFCDIVQHGLTERCEATKTATMKLICSKWMKAAKFDPVELVRIMGVTVSDEECEKALKVILQTVRSGDHSPMQELSDPEIRSFCANIDKSMVHLKDSSVVFDEYQLFYTRVACSTAKDSTDLSYTQKEDILSKAAPDIPTLCDLFQKHVARYIESVQEGDQESEDQESFVCLQLLQLAKVAGLYEEGSRRHFANVMAKTLSFLETPEDLVEECIESLRAAHEEDENEFFDAISVIVAALMTATERVGDLVLEDDKIFETTMRVLFMFSVVLEKASSTLASHALLDDMVKIILSAVSSCTKSIRELGVSCFGKLGLLSPKNTVLLEFKPILLQLACNEGEALQCRGQALLSLADWALLYSEVLQSQEFDDGQSLSMIDCVHAMMGHSNESIVAIASEVAAKLLFAEKVKDKKLMGRLLAVFLDPNLQKEKDDEEMESDDKAVGSSLRLQQLLSIFFPAFCVKSIENRSFVLESIQDSLLVASSLTKTKKRPLVFPLIKIVDFVCSIVSQSDTAVAEQEKERSMNEQKVALSSSCQVARFLVKYEEKLSVTQRRALCKYLGGQNIDASTGDKRLLLVLKACVEELAYVADSSSTKSLRPLVDLMQGVSGVLEENAESMREAADSGAESSDDDTVTENSDERNLHGDDDSTGESTVEEVLMDSLATLSMSAKENPVNSSKSGRLSSTARRSSTQSNMSVLESLGSPNNV